MPKRRKPIEFSRPREITTWHLYKLQSLSPSQFSDVAQKILDGRYVVVTTKGATLPKS